MIALWLSIGLLTGGSPVGVEPVPVTPPSGGWWTPLMERRHHPQPDYLELVEEPAQEAPQEAPQRPKPPKVKPGQSLPLIVGEPAYAAAEAARAKALALEAQQAALEEAQRQQAAIAVANAEAARLQAERDALMREEEEMAAILLVMLSAA